MTTMVIELYDALVDAGASDATARKAAEAVTRDDERFERLEQRLEQVDRRIEQVAAELDRKIEQVDRKIDRVAAELDRKIDRLDSKIDQVAATLRAEIVAGRSDNVLLKWMIGAVFGLLIPIFLKLFMH